MASTCYRRNAGCCQLIPRAPSGPAVGRRRNRVEVAIISRLDRGILPNSRMCGAVDAENAVASRLHLWCAGVLSMPNPLKRILVPVDFHVPSRAALMLASDFAGALGASIDVLHVVDVPGGSSLFVSEGHVPVPDAYRAAIEQQAADRLKEWLVTTSAPAGASSQVAEGRPADEIVRYASNHSIDLIVMGTHGRAGMAHLFTGSVTENVVRTAHCPVVTVRA